jgi:uncharacterized protein
MDLNAARNYILNLMNEGLSPELHYHSIAHTLDVHDSCLRLAGMEGVNGKDLALLETAAYFHDSGIIHTYKDHEEASVRLAKEILPGFGYTDEDITIIGCMIMKTKLPQNAINLLGEILCDADLDYLGRKDFFMIAQRLRYEWELMDIYFSLHDWYEMQIKFLSSHTYYTRAARLMRNDTKEKNLAEIRKMLGR